MTSLILLCVTVLLTVTTTIVFGQGVEYACGLFEEHRTCGPNCPPTCDTLKDTICCEVKCVTGCFCRDGYMLLSKNGQQKCVPISTCPRPGVLKFEEGSVIAFEGDNIMRIKVIRINGSYGEVRVRWRVVFKAALSYPAYDGLSGVLVFPDGVVSQVIEIPIVDNSVRGPDITFHIELYEPSNKVEIAEDEPYSLLTIKDDDMKPGYLELEKTEYVVAENAGSLMVCVIRRDGTDGQIRVKYKTRSVTALLGTDFVPVTGELVFEEGEVKKHIYVNIVDNDIREPTKTFEVDIFDPIPGEGIVNFRGLGLTQTSLITITDDDMKPGTFEVEKTNYVVSESVGNLQIGILRIGGTDGQIKIRYKTLVKSAVAAVDFFPVQGELVFDEGEIRKTIDVKIIDDDLREPTKTFEILLFDPVAGPGVINFRNHGFQQTVTVTVTDDDMQPGYFELERPTYVVPENVGVLRIGVLRVDGTDGQIRVRYRTTVKTALAVIDFIPVTGELVFEERETKKFIDIVIVDDGIREPTKSFEIQLFDPTPGSGVINFRGFKSTPTALVTIIDNDMRPGYFELEKSNYIVSESVGTVKIGVIRVGGKDGQISIRYKTTVKTALVNVDFMPVTGELVFQDGEVKKYIDIQILNDNIREPTKTFDIQLYDPTPGFGVINFRNLGSQLISSITITDDDMTPGYFELERTNYVISENIGTLKIGVLRLGGTDGQIRLRYKTVVRTALINADFFPVEGELVFEDGESKKFIDIQIIDDNIREPTKTFEVQLFDPAPGNGVLNFRGLGSTLTTLVTINDNDMTPGYLELEYPSYNVQENVPKKMVCVKRYGGTDGELRVKFQTVSGTAIAGKDFVAMSGELIFGEGVKIQHIMVPIINNDIRQPDRTFEVEIFDPSPGAGVINFRGLGRRLRTAVKIIDDDMNPGIFELEQTTYTVPENIGILKIGVLRVNGADGIMRVGFKSVSKTALPSSDFLSVAGELLFEEGVTKKYIEIPIVDNNISGPSKTFEIQLLDPVDGDGVINFRRFGTKKTSLITITDDDMKPGFLQMEQSIITVTENVGTIRVTVVRVDGTDGQVRVWYRFVPITAQPIKDFVGLPGELVFNNGQTKKTIPITIINDNIRESTESFRVELYDQGVSPGVFSFRNHESVTATEVVITDDDMTPGQIEMKQSLITVQENVGVVDVSIVRLDGTDGQLRVKYKTVDGTAMAPADYTPISGELVFEEGEIQKVISIKIENDLLTEGTENFHVRLFDLEAGAGVLNFRSHGLKMQTTIAIIDDDLNSGVLVMEKENIITTEDAAAVQVSIVRTGGTQGTLVVRYRTADGTALAGADYVPSEGEIVFTNGEIRKVINIRILNDNIKEPVKSFAIELLDPFNRNLGNLRKTLITIMDDDKTSGIFQFLHSRITVSEGQSKLLLPIVRRGGSDGAVTLQWRTKDRTTTEEQDYKPLEGSVTFNDGEVEKSISIDIVDDELRENDEEFLVGLFNPINGGVLGPINTVIVTIRDNDSEEKQVEEKTEIFFVRKTVRVKRSVGKVRLHIKRTGDLAPITIFMTTKDGSARGGVDYRRTRGEVTFFENEIELTVELRLLNSSSAGGEKSFQVEISRPSKGIILPTGNVATIIIENDTPSEISGRGSLSIDGSVSGGSQTWSVSGSHEIRSEFTGQSGSIPLPSLDIPAVQHQQFTQVNTKFIPLQPPQGTGQGTKRTCPEGMTFKLCAPSCPKTCQTMNDPEHCQKKCVNACFCPDGQVIENLDSLKCVEPQDCAGFRSLGKLAGVAGLGGLLAGLGGLVGVGAG